MPAAALIDGLGNQLRARISRADKIIAQDDLRNAHCCAATASFKGPVLEGYSGQPLNVAGRLTDISHMDHTGPEAQCGNCGNLIVGVTRGSLCGLRAAAVLDLALWPLGNGGE